MREIKFRVWDKKPKRIIGNIGVFPNKGNAPSLSLGSDGILVNPNSKEFELMQFTGLQDKNGVDIYEGDIIETSGYPFYTEDGRNYVGDVFYWEEEAAFYYTLHLVSDRVCGKACGGMLSELPNIEINIIGNIHQHPELLEN